MLELESQNTEIFWLSSAYIQNGVSSDKMLKRGNFGVSPKGARKISQLKYRAIVAYANYFRR